jgi:hypothetical protein
MLKLTRVKTALWHRDSELRLLGWLVLLLVLVPLAVLLASPLLVLPRGKQAVARLFSPRMTAKADTARSWPML